MVMLQKPKLGNLTCVKNAFAANLIFLNGFILNLQSKKADTCETDTAVKSSGQLTFLESEVMSSCFMYFPCFQS